MSAAVFLSLILQWLPAIMKGIPQAIELWRWGAEVVGKLAEDNRDATPEEEAELDSRSLALRTLLHSDDV